MKTHGARIVSRAKRFARAEVDRSWAGSEMPDQAKNLRKLADHYRAMVTGYAAKIDRDIAQLRGAMQEIVAFCEITAEGNNDKSLPIPADIYNKLKLALEDTQP